METKICSKCKKEKSKSEYYTIRTKLNKIKIYSCCKPCWNKTSSDSSKKYRDAINARVRLKHKENPSLKRKDARNHALKYPDKIKERWKKYYIKNREKLIQRAKEYAATHERKYTENKKQYGANYYKKKVEKQKLLPLDVQEENKQKNRDRLKICRRKNIEKYRTREKSYLKNKRDTDPLYKLAISLRNRIYCVFNNKNINKTTKTEQLLGIDYETAKQYIERKFKKGMTWENHGEWHLDHIIPLSSAKTEEELKTLCHYTNLQPLWAKDNLKKHAKVLPIQTILTI